MYDLKISVKHRNNTDIKSKLEVLNSVQMKFFISANPKNTEKIK